MNGERGLAMSSKQTGNCLVPSHLTGTDLQRPRTQTELRAWVDQLYDQFGRTEEGKRAVRLNKGNLVKEFIEEVWPLALFADVIAAGISPEGAAQHSPGREPWEIYARDH